MRGRKRRKGGVPRHQQEEPPGEGRAGTGVDAAAQFPSFQGGGLLISSLPSFPFFPSSSFFFFFARPFPGYLRSACAPPAAPPS